MIWIISTFFVITVLYYYLDKRYKINELRSTLPFNQENKGGKNHYIHFYYGSNLSHSENFKLCLETRLPMNFIDSRVKIYYQKDLETPYFSTSRRDHKHIWKVINTICHIAKQRQ